jgi:hypothetical protein
MAIPVEHVPFGEMPFRETSNTDRVYAPDILPLLQSLLADLADMDFTYEINLEAIRHSPGDDDLKREMIKRLQRHRDERRAAHVQEFAALQERIATALA